MNLRAVKVLGSVFEIEWKKRFAYPVFAVARFFAVPISICLIAFIWSSLIKFGFKTSLAEVLPYLVFVNSLLDVNFRTIEKGIGRDILTGNIVSYLIRPVPFTFVHMSRFFVSYFEAFLRSFPFVILLFAIFQKSFNIWFFPFYFLAGMLIFFLGACIGCLAFWFEQVWGISASLNAVRFFFAGALIPLQFFPPWLMGIANLLPFPLMGHIPVMIALGKLQPSLAILSAYALWIFLFYAIYKTLYFLGIRKLSGHGV